jgi:hypothetical protein
MALIPVKHKSSQKRSDYEGWKEDTLEEVLLEHGHSGDDTRLAADLESVHLHVGRDHGGREFGVGGSSCTAAADGFSDVVDLSDDK